MLQAFVDLVPLQDLVHLGIERMACRLGNLLGAQKQWFLLRSALALRHTVYDVRNISDVTCFGSKIWTSATGCQVCAFRSAGGLPTLVRALAVRKRYQVDSPSAS